MTNCAEFYDEHKTHYAEILKRSGVYLPKPKPDVKYKILPEQKEAVSTCWIQFENFPRNYLIIFHKSFSQPSFSEKYVQKWILCHRHLHHNTHLHHHLQFQSHLPHSLLLPIQLEPFMLMMILVRT